MGIAKKYSFVAFSFLSILALNLGVYYTLRADIERRQVSSRINLDALEKLRKQESEFDAIQRAYKDLQEMEKTLNLKVRSNSEMKLQEFDQISFYHAIKGFLREQIVEFSELGIPIEDHFFGFDEYVGKVDLLSENRNDEHLEYEFVLVKYLLSIMKEIGVTSISDLERNRDSDVSVTIVFEGTSNCLQEFLDQVEAVEWPLQITEFLVNRVRRMPEENSGIDDAFLIPVCGGGIFECSITVDLKEWDL